MSLIFGVNLSDRIYLSADTRLTVRNNKNGDISFDDNVLKIELFSNDLAVAMAGDAKMASFLINKIFDSEVVKRGIRYCREHILNTITPFVDEYLKSNKYSNVVFIFGGLDRNGKKIK